MKKIPEQLFWVKCILKFGKCIESCLVYLIVLYCLYSVQAHKDNVSNDITVWWRTIQGCIHGNTCIPENQHTRVLGFPVANSEMSLLKVINGQVVRGNELNKGCAINNMKLQLGDALNGFSICAAEETHHSTLTSLCQKVFLCLRQRMLALS